MCQSFHMASLYQALHFKYVFALLLNHSIRPYTLSEKVYKIAWCAKKSTLFEINSSILRLRHYLDLQKIPAMLIDFLLLGLAFLFAIPAITGYFAYSHGRSFWLWFTIGCLLPVIANFIIAYLCRKEALKAQRRKLADLSRYEDESMEIKIRELVSRPSIIRGKKVE